MKSKRFRIELNDGHLTEMLDRLHFATCYIEEFLLHHPVADLDINLKLKLIAAQDLLGDAYQLAGGLKIESEKNVQTGTMQPPERISEADLQRSKPGNIGV